MITIYGSDQCPKTVKILKLCKERGIEANYRNFDKELKSIWEFVVMRDEKSKRLGIPGIVCENGHTFDGGEEPFDAEAVMHVIAENAKDLR